MKLNKKIIKFAKDNGGCEVFLINSEEGGIILGYYIFDDFGDASILIELFNGKYGWRGDKAFSVEKVIYTANKLIDKDKTYTGARDIKNIKLRAIKKDEIVNLIKALEL